MRIDAHQHFWRYTQNAAEYAWIGESMHRIRRDFMPDDLAPALDAAGIDGSVAVQARQSLEETRWLLELASSSPKIKAVVGWVPLASETLSQLLDGFCAHPKFRGLRHVVQDEPDPAFLDGERFNSGIRQLTGRGLVYDLLVTARQLPAALRFVDRHPNQRFVLDHIAKPVVSPVVDPVWSGQLRELGRRPNVTCKFSGVITEAPGWRWSPALIRPYFDHVLGAFGPGRVMFGSDWPVCLVAGDYSAWVAAVESLCAPLSLMERASILGGTAAAAYSITA